MIRINQIKLPINHTDDDMKRVIRKNLKLRDEKFEYKIVKKSIDARKDEVKYIYSVDVKISGEQKILRRVNNKDVMLTDKKNYTVPEKGTKKMIHRPVVVGSGPAGLFCAYLLAREGYMPIVIERGEEVEKRTKTVNDFFETGILNTESNVQFGEGGAGTFSDGKLNTLVKDKFGRNDFVLETFVKFGADEKITYENKPHVGTDILEKIVKNMREECIKFGAQFLFSTKLYNIKYKDESLSSIEVINNGIIKEVPCEVLVLAIGHSARDTFKMLFRKGIKMEAKSFAVGVRVEHNQEHINISQYGRFHEQLPAASYRLATTLDNNRNVYSFCMCPGGYVVNASSENEMTAVNGMSYSKRDGKNANTALIVSVNPEDFGSDSPLAGMEVQRRLERAAYKEGNGSIPVQRFEDFKNKRVSSGFGEVIPQTKGKNVMGDLNNVLPEYVCESLVTGIDYFSTKIKGYNSPDTVLSGVESRTSSPVRINRDEYFECNIKGIYPCGEGAGYAGGITSAAMDGIKVFEGIAKKYAALTD